MEWKDVDLWIGYAQAIMGFCGTVPIVERETSGSQDPFVLISKKLLETWSTPLYKLLEATIKEALA